MTRAPENCQMTQGASNVVGIYPECCSEQHYILGGDAKHVTGNTDDILSWITAVIVVQHFLFFWTDLYNLIYILGYISMFHILSQPHLPVSCYTPEDA